MDTPTRVHTPLKMDTRIRAHTPLKMGKPTRVHTPLKIDTPLRVLTSLERNVPLLKDTPPGGGHIPIVNSTAKVIQKTLPSTIVPNELPKVNGEPPGTHYALNYSNPPRFSSRQPVLHSTPKDVYTGILLETFTVTNQQSAKDCARLQKLADLCADIDCQMTYLPGLACLNYPIAIRPIIEKLPASLRSKWEKEIVRYAEEHNDAHPTFREFSTMIQNEARKKNHPEVSEGSPATSSGAPNRHRDDNKRRHLPQSGDEVKEALKTKMDPDSDNVPEKGPSVPPKKKHCLFHKRAGHKLTECKAFNKLTVKEREQWVMEERLCFRCF